MASAHLVLRKQPPAQFPMQFGNDELPPPPPPRDAPSAPIYPNMNHPLPPLPPPKDSERKLRKSVSADRPNHRQPSPKKISPHTDDIYQPAAKTLPPIQTSPQMNEFYPPAEKALPSIRPVAEPAEPPKGSRPNSAAAAGGSRPGSANSGTESDGSAPKGRKRMSWLPGSRSRSRHPSQEVAVGKQAWITQDGSIIEYNMSLLQNGSKVPELWVEEGDTFIYLFPQSTARLASFKIPRHLLSSSKILLDLIESHSYAGGHGRNRSFGGRGQLEASDANRSYGVQAINTPPITPNTYPVDSRRGYDSHTPMMSPEYPSPGAEMHLYFPTGIMTLGSQMEPADNHRLIDVRNLFAFLLQQPLIITPHRPSLFKVLLDVAAILREFKFTNIDGSTLGEAAAMSFEGYINLPDFRLSEICNSREKTLEMLVLAEAMKSAALYNEAFTHAVGKFDAIQFSKYPIYGQISQTTQERLSLAVIELNKRQASVADRLTTFDFPSVFAGIASSTSRLEARNIRFKQWKLAFISMRKWFIEYLKVAHGAWPPKASHNKNRLSGEGLNRVVLKELYRDLCQLYALLVDRESFTTRTEEPHGRVDGTTTPEIQALRTLLSEYDHSSPPVQPAIPFDVPLIPGIHTVDAFWSKHKEKDKSRETNRKLKATEIPLVLNKSYNNEMEARTSKNPLLQEFMLRELKQSEGKSSQELADARYGTWIFLYAVIQALPLLVIDAPGIVFKEGVQYFLCQPSIGIPPWVEGADVASWYAVNGQTVLLPSHSVENSTDAIYRRSDCWLMAAKWLGNESDPSSIHPSPDLNGALSPLKAPPGFMFGGRPQSRGRSRNEGPISQGNNFSSLNLGSPRSTPTDQAIAERRAARSRNRKSLAIGLEKVPMPGNYKPYSPQTNPYSAGTPISGNSSFSASTTTFSNSASGQYSSVGRPYPSSRTASDGSESHSRDGSASGRDGYRPPSGNAQGGYRPPSGGGAASTQTFDDILGKIGNQQNGEEPKPKKLGKKKK